ncbi:hypothetical protein B4129_1925 [Bacillus safensis]|nr:hypothetical protein B4129_1925 [Bacillus safensis]
MQPLNDSLHFFTSFQQKTDKKSIIWIIFSKNIEKSDQIL